MAEQDCGELETCPAVAPLGQGLVPQGGDIVSGAVGSVGGAFWGWVEIVRANSALRDNLRVDFMFPLSLVLYGTLRLALLSKKIQCVDRNYYIPQFYVYYVNMLILKKE